MDTVLLATSVNNLTQDLLRNLHSQQDTAATISVDDFIDVSEPNITNSSDDDVFLLVSFNGKLQSTRGGALKLFLRFGASSPFYFAFVCKHCCF